MLGRLLDNYEFELSDYISAQSEFLSNGMYFKVTFKRTLRNFQLQLCNQIFHRNFIAVTDDDYSTLVDQFSSFAPKHLSYRYSNPLIVDAKGKVQFYLMDNIEKPTINELIMEEFPNQGDLVRNNHTQRNHTSYLGRPEITDKLNEQKHFYIFVTNLKQPEIPADFTFFMKNIQESQDSRFRLSKQIDKAKHMSSRPNLKRLLKEIGKVEDLLKLRYCGVTKVMQYKYILEHINISLFDYSLNHYKNPLNVKRILASSEKYSNKFKDITPSADMRTFKLVMSRGDQYLYKE